MFSIIGYGRESDVFSAAFFDLGVRADKQYLAHQPVDLTVKMVISH